MLRGRYSFAAAMITPLLPPLLIAGDVTPCHAAVMADDELLPPLRCHTLLLLLFSIYYCHAADVIADGFQTCHIRYHYAARQFHYAFTLVTPLLPLRFRYAMLFASYAIIAFSLLVAGYHSPLR